MKYLLLAAVGLSLFLTGCDSNSGSGSGEPSAIDKLLGRATPTPVPTPVPGTPKPKSGSWMFDKDRRNPLDQPAKKK
jgi:hypothetical protein